MRWDENCFYVGVKVVDPDFHRLLKGTSNTWDGDAIQMRVDKAGPNAATDGQEFVVNENYTTPWSSKNVPDFLFGYVQIAGGFSEAWENTSNKGMTSFSKNPMGAAKCVVAPAGSSYSSDTQKGITTYETGIPWTYILNGESDKDNNQITSLTYTTYSAGKRGNPTGGIGREFGVSLVCLEDGNTVIETGSCNVDAFMAWGSGICGAHQTDGAKTCTGSNSVMLSDVKVTQTKGYTTYNPQSLLDASFSQENIDKPGVFYDYLAGDTYRETPVKYEDLSVLTYDTDPDGDLAVWGYGYLGSVSDIGGEHGNVLDYSNFYGLDKGTPSSDTQTYIQTGSEEFKYHFPTSYTLEFDIKYNDTVVVANGYDSALYNWFGGANVYSFMCGYFFNDKAFKIVNTDDATQVLASYSYDLKKDNWYTWRFQFDNESCTARLWIDDKSTTADDGEGWGKMIFNTCWRYFYYSNQIQAEEGTPLLFRMMNTQVQYDNIKIYNFGSISTVATADENPEISGGGGSGAQTTTTVTGGGDVHIDSDKITKVDGKWHVPVEVKDEYLNATQLSFTLTYDTNKAKFDSIEGLADGTFTVEETTPGTVVVTITDFTEIKKLKSGDTMFEFVLTATDPNAKVEDLNLNLTDSFVYTVTTGDTMTYIVIGSSVALALVGSVIVIRRRKSNEV